MTASLSLADNLRALRGARGLTQLALSKASGVPRATLATMESGMSNPTLDVLLKIAKALRVTLEELVSAPHADMRHWRGDELPVTRRGGAEIRRLLPEPLPGLVIERMRIESGSVFVGTPHIAGTREYLTCELGNLELAAAGETWRLNTGDVVSFRGDQRHSYRNVGRGDVVAMSVVVLGAASPT